MNQGQTDFQINYAQLSDDQLAVIAGDRENLVPEAAAALDSEIQKRGVKLNPSIWVREASSDQRVHSLQDYEWFQQLCRKRQFTDKYGRALAIGPVFLAFGLAATVLKNHELFAACVVGLTVIWTLLVATYSLALLIRSARFKCPQCGRRFGTDAECWSCAFPREPKR